MRFSRSRALVPSVLAFCFLAVAPRLGAQIRPSPEQAQQLLQQRPELLDQLRKRLLESGLTPEQVRSRLKAEGYPETLLDAYLPGGTGQVDPRMRDSASKALRSLGISDTLDVMDNGEYSRQLDTLRGPQRDSLFAYLRDTLGLDSVALRQRLRTRTDSLRYLKEFFELRQQADSGFRVFGLDLFQKGTADQFQANSAGPVDPSYRLGPGDRLVLILTGDVESTDDLEVTREGFVVIPKVGQLYVANLTLGQLEDVLYTRLGRSYSGVRRGAGATTRFSVSVSRLRSLQVFVVGDVTKPGSYRISSAGTAFTALYAAGGPTLNGSLRSVQVKRAGKVVASLDAYEYLLKGDASNDVRLENGDVVFVPAHGPRVRVLGGVIRPATYEARENESVLQAIRFAGGYTAAADRRVATVERIVPAAERTSPGSARTVLSVQGDGMGTVTVRDGDVLRIARLPDRVRGRVVVRGNVWTPGLVGLGAGLTLSGALKAAGGIRSDTYLGRVLVSRMRSDSSRVQLRSAFTDSTGRLTDDLALQEDDEVTVFSVAEMRARRYVTIAGAVRKGGRFPYHDGMTMRDLVLMGGGLDQSAWLTEAEIARLPESRAAGATAVSLRVALDSSYLFERAPDGRYAGPPGVPAAAGGSADAPLQPYDNVLIFRQPQWELQRLVWLTGEVRFPGRYALLKRDERLSDIVTRAGGLTSEAYGQGVQFYRNVDSVGRVALNLERALRDVQDADNLNLVDGDSVHITRYNPVVKVRGAVNNSSAVALRDGANILYYVRSAGGAASNATKRGDERRAYVIQPNGQVETIRPWPWWVPLSSRKPTPLGGAEVVVPERDPAETSSQQTFAQISALLSVLAPLITVYLTTRR
jgi:polysaccharide biosynthesis/export protein